MTELDVFINKVGHNINNINLEVYEGEFLTLLGSSGCGKTTILRSISGLDYPTSGKVYIDGEDVTNLEPPKRQVNTIFQNYALFPLMTIYDNIAFGLRMKKVPEDEIKTRVNEMLELVHLEGYEKRKPNELSGGEQQRVSVARSLAKKPKVLFLDEPTGALDEETGRQVLDYICKLHKEYGFTIVMVTHNQNIAEMANTVIKMNSGRIAEIYSNSTQKTAYEIGW